MSNIHFDVTPGKAYYSDTGELLNIEPDLDTYGEDVISVYVCTKDSPDVWVHDNDILLRDASKNYVPRNSNVCRVRLVYNGFLLTHLLRCYQHRCWVTRLLCVLTVRYKVRGPTGCIRCRKYCIRIVAMMSICRYAAFMAIV